MHKCYNYTKIKKGEPNLEKLKNCLDKWGHYTQPRQIQKTSKSTTRKHMLSKLTTRKALTIQIALSQGFRLILTCSLNVRIGQFPSGGYYGRNLEMPLYQALFHTYFSTLVINTTVSTWLEPLRLMLFARYVSGNISMTYFENIGMRV